MSDASLGAVAASLAQGRAEDAVAALEALADQGLEGVGASFDRGLAYAMRAKGGAGRPGDLGRSAHAFEEALRHDPHDGGARAALDAVRREIARRATNTGGRAIETSGTPVWRSVVTSAHADAWTGLALGSSMLLSLALATRSRLRGPARIWAHALAAVTALTLVLAGALYAGNWWVRHRLREAVIVSPRPVARVANGAPPLELLEGARVDVVEEREGEALIENEIGRGWITRDAIRMLPPMRP